MKIQNAFNSLIFPSYCLICEKETEDKIKNKIVCTNCLKELRPRSEFICPNCPTKSVEGRLCLMCQDNCPLDRVFSMFRYEEKSGIQKLIHSYKYKFIRSANTVIKELCKKWLEKENHGGLFDQVDLIIPVPISRIKFNWRGYNQSELIALGLSEILNRKVNLSLQRKGLFPTSQAKLENYEERRKNVKGKFQLNEPENVKGKNILLVDDVYTSGATMQECSRALKDAGAKEVWGFAIARG